MRRLAFVTMLGSIVLSVSTFGLVSASASAYSLAKPLPCHAAMSNTHPADFTTTTVRVRTAPHAQVTTVAHYRTVNRQHHRQANGRGKASIPYYISGATPGYRVRVDVTVRWPHRTGSCQTSFTPHA